MLKRRDGFCKISPPTQKVLKRDKIYDIIIVYYYMERTMDGQKKKIDITEYVPVWCMALFVMALIALGFEIYSRFDPVFADAVCETCGRAVRLVLAKITDPLPFSLAEALLLSSPIIVGIIVIVIIRAGNVSAKRLVSTTVAVLSLISVIYSTFVFGYGTGYYGRTIDKKLGMRRAAVSSEELYLTALKLMDGAASELDSVIYPEGTYSYMGCSYDEMNEKLNAAWKKVADEYGCFGNFTSRTKPVLLSEPMTHMHLAGIYCLFTGEANVNVNYPDFIVVTSAAHEMAHQRGVCREDEANFMAFLVCISSDDPYLRYSGYLDMLNEVLDRLYGADKALYKEVINRMPGDILNEFVSYSEFFDKYRTNVAATVTNAVNNAYITYHGQPEGTKSYGLVADLLVSYELYGKGADGR